MTLIVTAAVATAGCAQDLGDAGGDLMDDVDPPEQMSREQARATLAAAVDDVPARFALDMEVVQGSQQLATVLGVFDEDVNLSYVAINGDPDFVAAFSGTSDSEMTSDFQPGSMVIYSSPDGVALILDAAAFVMPPGNETEEDAMGPDPDEFAFEGDEFFESLDDVGNITEVNPRVYRGQAAVEVVTTKAKGNMTVTSTFISSLDPARLLYLETDVAFLQPEEEETAEEGEEEAFDPYADARVKGDLYYGEEVTQEPSEQAVRAVGLRYENSARGAFFAPSSNQTWTFQVDSGIPLDEIEIQVKDEPEEEPEDDASSDGLDFGATPSVFEMSLADGSHSEDGVALVFTDVDGDGTVSAGDTLEITVDEEREQPTILVYDTVTETYIVPGPGLFLGLAALGAVALLTRRRR